MTDSVAARLSKLVADEAKNWTFSPESTLLPETQFTGKVLYPRVNEFVRGLGRKSLVVRSDGATAPHALVMADMVFYPDIEIVEFHSRFLAIEVKFLRDSDPSGSLSKALGQAWLYQSLGFECAHLVLIDCRNGARNRWNHSRLVNRSLPSGLTVSLFTKEPNGSFTATETGVDLQVE